MPQAVATTDGRPAEIEDLEDTGRLRFYLRHERLVLGAAAVGIFLSVWEAISRSGTINPIFLSSPSRIAVRGFTMFASGEIYEHLWVSGAEFLWGYLLAITMAVPIGLLAGWYPRLNFVLDPFLAALYATPRIAFLPVIILWVGIGIWSKIAIVFLGAFFPICISALAGVKTVDRTYLKVAQSFRADHAHIFRTIVVPSCVPFILAGLRLGAGRALVGVVVGEMYAATAGLGFLITVAGMTLQTDTVFVGVAIIGGIGIVCNELLSKAERRFERWRPRVGAAT